MHKSLTLALLWMGTTLVSTSSSSSSSSDEPDDVSSLDGSYRFTSLAASYQINVCTNDADETYMSMNVVNTEDCPQSNYILGVFRDLTGAHEIDDDKLALFMDGFQRELPSGDGFDDMSYKIECDTDSEPVDCKLIRANGAETFELEKISNTPTVNCYEPGGRFEDILFAGGPALYKSGNLAACDTCGNIAPCFEKQSVNDEELSDACFAFVDNSDVAFAGGPMQGVRLEWEGRLSLESYEDNSVSEGGAGASGSQITILDPNNAETGTIIFSWRRTEGDVGYVYPLEQINLQEGVDSESCPLLTIG